MVRIEGILNLDGNILDADGIDGRWIDDFCTEVTKFHRLYVTEFVDGIGCLDDAWVGSHEAVNICPDFQNVCVERCCDDAGGIVAAATSQIRCFHRISVASDEARNHTDSRHISKLFFYQFICQFCI